MANRLFALKPPCPPSPPIVVCCLCPLSVYWKKNEEKEDKEKEQVTKCYFLSCEAIFITIVWSVVFFYATNEQPYDFGALFLIALPLTFFPKTVFFLMLFTILVFSMPQSEVDGFIINELDTPGAIDAVAFSIPFLSFYLFRLQATNSRRSYLSWSCWFFWLEL